MAIAGAGPAGCAAALYLARQGRAVAVFDKQHFPRDKPCGEGLMPAGVSVLRELGVLPDLLAHGAPWIRGVAFSAPGAGPVEGAFPRGCGLGVRRTVMDAALARLVEAEQRVRVHYGCAATDICLEPLELSTAHGRVHARSVVVADGLRSPLRKALGWRRSSKGPSRYGLVGHVRTQSTPAPWIEVAVGEGQEVFSAPSGPSERLVAVLGGKSILRGASLDACYRRVVGPGIELSAPLMATGPFALFPIKVADGGVFLLGDAAGFLDPVTGQGLETALRSARLLAGILGFMLDGKIDQEKAARWYTAEHRRLGRDRDALTRLALWLMASAGRTRRAMRSLERHQGALTTLLGVNCGYWGVGRLRPVDLLALLAGH